MNSPISAFPALARAKVFHIFSLASSENFHDFSRNTQKNLQKFAQAFRDSQNLENWSKFLLNFIKTETPFRNSFQNSPKVFQNFSRKLSKLLQSGHPVSKISKQRMTHAPSVLTLPQAKHRRFGAQLQIYDRIRFSNTGCSDDGGLESPESAPVATQRSLGSLFAQTQTCSSSDKECSFHQEVRLLGWVAFARFLSSYPRKRLAEEQECVRPKSENPNWAASAEIKTIKALVSTAAGPRRSR